MVIVVGGMIGLGKSSVAKVLGESFGTEVFYESVDDNKVLPLFYSETEEEIQKRRYPFLLQLWFLDTRFKSIKEALVHNNNVLDRSIYEDWYFAKKNMELGRITELEFEIYENLLNNMLDELEELPKKSPDLMVYLKGSFETVLNRISKRGREYELDEGLKDYYYTLWKDYDNWVMEHYKASQVLIIDMDVMDVVNNEIDKKQLIRAVDEKLKELRGDDTNKMVITAKMETTADREDILEVAGIVKDVGRESVTKFIVDDLENISGMKVTDLRFELRG